MAISNDQPHYHFNREKELPRVLDQQILENYMREVSERLDAIEKELKEQRSRISRVRNRVYSLEDE